MRIYGGAGGIRECKCAFNVWTNVDFPEPAMPMAMMHTGDFFASADMAADGTRRCARGGERG